MDLHGKVSEQLHLDLGAAPLEAVWPEDQSFVRALKFNFCKKLDQVRQAHTQKKKSNIILLIFLFVFFLLVVVLTLFGLLFLLILPVYYCCLFVDVMVEDLEMLFI